jgi:hypothetical protein
MDRTDIAPGIMAERVSAAEPVEYVGQIDGRMWFYFTASGFHWHFVVANTIDAAKDIGSYWLGLSDDEPFYARGYYGTQEGDADLMHHDQAETLIIMCADLWRQASDVRLQPEAYEET